MLHLFEEHKDDDLYPELSDKDKLKSLVNILRGHEEFILDSTGVIISSNLEAVTITGYEEWEVIGKSISLFYAQEDREKYKYEHDLYKASKELKYSTTELKIKKHGDQFLATTKFEAIYNNDGELNGFRVTLQDATHKAIYDIGTKKIKEENSNLYKNPFVGIFRAFITDLSFAKLNSKAIEIFGVDSNCSKLSNIFSCADDFIRFKEILFKDGFVDNFMLQIANDKVEIYCVISCTLFRDEGFIEGVIKDITESRKQAIEIQKVKAELDNFLYRASHDIRAPLATILGLTNLIKVDKSASMVNVLEYVKLIEERVSNLDSVLKELSDVSYNNLHDIRVEKINIEVVLRRIMKPLREKFPFVNTQITIAFASPIFYSDLSRVKVILDNVIYNAFVYHDAAKTNPHVKILVSQTGSTTVFEIDDNGIGVEQTHLTNIYDMFFRIQSDRGGSGLGLFVTKSMIDKLGGTISINSQIGKGTSVKIVLSNEARTQHKAPSR
jgi:PAS domain S-box-containing protein